MCYEGFFLLRPLSYDLHASQFSTTCLMSAAMFGQYRHSRALRSTLFTPRCDLWRHSFVSFRIPSGITTRSPQNISPSLTASSSLMLKYTWTGTSCLDSGQPCCIMFQHLQCLIPVHASLEHLHAFCADW